MQWMKLMAAVPVAFGIAACSSNRPNPDSATSAGVLFDSLGYGADTSPAKKPATATDSSMMADSLKMTPDSMMKDSVHRAHKTAKKSPKKGR